MPALSRPTASESSRVPRHRRIVAAALAVGFSCSLAVVRASYQTPGPEQLPPYEVISIKLHDPSKDRVPARLPLSVIQPGRFVGTDLMLVDLVLLAYRSQTRPLREQDLQNVPAWGRSTRYDIVATVNLTREEMFAKANGLMQSLLQDRFKFAAHLESRPTAAYTLVLARDDGRLGKQMTRTTTDCASRVPGPQPTALELMRRSPTDTLPPCDYSLSGPGRTSMRGVPAAQLARYLTSAMNRPVVDSTGLTGLFDIDLQFSTEPQSGPAATAAVSDLPLIVTAIQEQLGVKLESRQVPQDVVVIYRVEPPTPN